MWGKRFDHGWIASWAGAAALLLLLLGAFAAPQARADAPPAPPNCTASATSAASSGAPVAVPAGPAVVSSTIEVSGAGNYLTDADVLTDLTHAFPADLDVTVTSPAGTVVTLTTDNAGSNTRSFGDGAGNATRWDDDANPGGQVPHETNDGVATDHGYVTLTVATPLVPEEALGAFVGENPNGTWTLTISDDRAVDGGTLSSWRLDLQAIPSAPTISTATAASSAPVAVPTGPEVISSTIAVSGAGGYLTDADVVTDLVHAFPGDLDVTLTSPAGTVVTLTTDNGGTIDQAFGDGAGNGTRWDDDADPAGQVPYESNDGVATDHVYTASTVAAHLVPEEALGAFIGENPNGNWTLTVSDDGPGDGGTLNSWRLDLSSGSCGPPPDTTPPRLALSGATKQKADGSIEVGATCDEACTLAGDGKLTVKSAGKSRRGARKSYGLKEDTDEAEAGAAATLSLKLPKKAKKATTAALTARKPGKAKATIEIAAADSAGQSSTASRTVKLKPPR